MDQWVMRTMLVPDAIVGPVRALADSFGPASQNMWRTECSLDGAPPATWWISSGLISVEFAAVLPFAHYNEAGEWVREPYDPAGFIEMAVGAGLPPISEDQVEAIMTAVDVSEQPPFEAMARLGLKLVTREGGE